ncbi:MAG: DUF4280 domain-containing protein [Sedimenticola sp.]
MTQAVTMGAVLKCTFGSAPSSMDVTSKNRVMQINPVANIMDVIPLKNILSFGMCSSATNPVVAAATTAALGVLTPMPCVPATAAPWVPGSPTILVGNMPILSDTSTLMCTWAGCISVTTPGQIPVYVK